MSPRFVLGRENVPCIAEVVNRSLKADCTDFTRGAFHLHPTTHLSSKSDDSNFVQNYFGVGLIFCGKKH